MISKLIIWIMYPGSQFKKTKAVFRDGVFLLLPRSWQHRVLFSSSVRDSSRLTTADTQHPSINGPFTHAHYIRHTKTPRITVCKFNLHAHSTCYILLLAWSKEGQKPAGVRFTPVVTNTCENLRIQYIFTMAICPYCSPTSSSHLVRFVSAFKKIKQ